MDYEAVWNEPEYVIKSEIDLPIITTTDENPSVTDRIVINVLRRMERDMQRIKEKYSKENT